MKLVVVTCLLVLSTATVYFSEEFPSDWKTRWVHTSKPDTHPFTWSAGKIFVDEAEEKGLYTSSNLKFYAISAQFPSFSNKDKSLVFQFTVKNEQFLDCGGGYFKILPEGFDQENFSGDTPYLVMFGPDVCGSEKRTHVLLPYDGKNHINNKKIKVETDNFSHQYTLVINPDNTFKVLIDNEEVVSSTIEEYFDILPPKEISDPEAKKPEDWVDNPTILDVNDVKPDGWDDVPEFIFDTEATKPEDWDEEKDGEWKAPKKRNPEYKGEWRQKTIPNPDYKGPWVAPKVPNPEYTAVPNLYEIGKAGGVGIEIWQVTSGTVFDNIFIGDSLDEAKEFSDRTFKKRKSGEPAVKQAIDEVEAEKSKKKDVDESEYEEIKEDL